MNEILREIIIRIFCTGIVCTVAVIVAGDGAAREPVRLACAALAVIMLATPLTNGIRDIASSLDYSDQLQQMVDEESQNARSAEIELTVDKLTESIENRLENADVLCSVQLHWGLDDTVFVIESVTLTGTFTKEQTQRAVSILVSEYGISKEGVVFAEVQK